jgi:hypothetical protein
MVKKELNKRPTKVRLAVMMFYMVCVIGVVRTTIIVLRHIDVRSPGFFITIKFLIFAISIFFIYQVGKGKNWARWVLVGIFIICWPIEYFPTFEELFIYPVNSFLGCVSLALFTLGLVCLFLKESSYWFVGRREAKTSRS